MTNNKQEKINNKTRLFWTNIIMQLIILGVVLYADTYKYAFIYAQVFLILALTTNQKNYVSAKTWESLYNDSLEAEIKEVE